MTLSDTRGTYTSSSSDSFEDVKRWLYYHSPIGLPSTSEQNLEDLRETIRELYDKATMCAMERFTRKVCNAIHKAIMEYPVSQHKSSEYHRLRELSRNYHERLTRYEEESEKLRKHNNQNINDWLRIAEDIYYGSKEV